MAPAYVARTRTRRHSPDQTRRRPANAPAVEDRVEDRVEARARSLSLTAGTVATLKRRFMHVAVPVLVPLDHGAVCARRSARDVVALVER